jgi:hypothetical protein
MLVATKGVKTDSISVYQPLTIDPLLLYAKLLFGTGNILGMQACGRKF